MTQFLRDEASDSEEDVTSLMLDGTYLSRNFATLGPVLGQPPCESYLTFNHNPAHGSLLESGLFLHIARRKEKRLITVDK